MASNFSTSSHATRWLWPSLAAVPLPPPPVGSLNSPTTVVSPITPSSSSASPVSSPAPLDFSRLEVFLFKYLYSDYQSRIARILSLRHRILASGQLLFKRFYITQSLMDFEPSLVALTCLFIAGKIEESPLNAKILLTAAGSLKEEEEKSNGTHGQGQGNDDYWMIPFPSYMMDDIFSMEFYILQGISYDLCLFHPFLTLNDCYEEFSIPPLVYQHAWAIVCDLYKTDLVLCENPMILAVAALCKEIIHS